MAYEILTELGFKPFAGVRRSVSNSLCAVRFTSGESIKCTLNHQFKVGNSFKHASSLKPRMKVSPNMQVVDISLINGWEYVYDAVEVKEGNHYLTNGATSHNCQFFGSSDTLIDGDKLQKLVFEDPVETDEEGIYTIHKIPEEKHLYAITVDVSEGIGKDYSVVSVFDITKQPYDHVAVYRCNTITPILLSDVVHKLAKKYNDAYVVVESNSIGKITADALYYDYEYDNMLTVSVDDG